jgi:hypothetical protein
LARKEGRALKGHLEGCEGCRIELDELRSIAAAIRDVRLAEAPRSFALTPQILERRAAPPAPSAPPLMAGMRLASAAVAVALTVMVIGDLSSAGNGNGGGDSAGSVGLESAMQSRNTEPIDADGGAGAESSGGEPAPAATERTGEYAADEATAERDAEATPAAPVAGDTLICPSAAAGSDGAAGGTGTGALRGTSAPTPITEGNLDAGVEPSATGDLAGASCLDSTAGTLPESPGAEVPAIADQSGGEAEADAPPEGDDGVSTLRVAEIVLAGVLITLLSGVALDFAVRRRRMA